MKPTIRSDLAKLIQGLKSRNDEVRYRAAKDLKQFVTGDLKEVEDYSWFIETLCADLTNMMNSSDVNEKKGAVIGMGCIADVDFMSMHSQYLKFANQVQSMGITGDLQLSALQARLIGQFGLILTNDYIEGQIKRACEVLTDDNKPETHKQFATLTLREIALHTPTSFFQFVSLFIDAINFGIRDNKLAVREMSAMALRAAFTVTAERESTRRKDPPTATAGWYNECVKQAFLGADEAADTLQNRRLARDDWAHGSLLLINEMLRSANGDHEHYRLRMESMAGMTIDQLIMNSSSGTQAIKISFSIKWPMSSGQEQIMKQRSQVVCSYACRQIITEKYHEVWDIVLKNLRCKSPQMIQILIKLISRLAAFNPSLFKSQYFKSAMDFLIHCLRKEREKPLIFLTIGMLANTVKHEFIERGYLKTIYSSIKTNLPGKDVPLKKRSFHLETALFMCISQLGMGVGKSIFEFVKEMLDSMLGTGLSHPLTECLRVLVIEIPQLKKDIQDGLLSSLSIILNSKSHRQFFSSKSGTLPGRELVNMPLSSTGENTDIAVLSLALRTLGTFGFEDHSLTHFVRHTANNFVSFVNCEHKEVRLEAVRTCSLLMTPLLMKVSRIDQASRSTLNTVCDILGKLLTTATSDPEPDVRLCVLESLDERFDPHLAQAIHLDSLFISLHDEMFEIRDVAMKILGRLSAVNPACVQPSLRRVLLQTLTELEHSGASRNKEQSARLLASLISTAPRFIQPYSQPLMIAILPKLKMAHLQTINGNAKGDGLIQYSSHLDQSLTISNVSLTQSHMGSPTITEPPSVIVAILQTVGELAQVSGHVMKSYINDLFPIILQMMQDSSSFNKRKVAVWTLGQLVSNTGFVVKPYEHNPELLDLLLDMLKKEEAKSIRQEVIRTLGLIGALDPFKLKIYSGQVDSVGDTGLAVSLHEPVDKKEVEMTQAELLVNLSWAGTDEFFAACSMSALMQVLRDPALRSQHDKIVQSIIFVFKALGSRSIQYLRQVMPNYLRCLREAHDSRLKEFLIHQLGAIMDIVKIHIKEFMPEIIELILANWRVSPGIQNNSISLFKHMVNALNTEFKPFLSRLIPTILKVLTHETNETILKLMLDVIPTFGYNLEEYVHILVPAMVRILDGDDVNFDVKSRVLEALAQMTDTLCMDDLSGHIVQSICRLLERQPELESPAMDMLTTLLVRMGQKFMVLLPLVHKTLNKSRIQHSKFTVALNKVSKSAFLRTVEDELKSYRSAATATRVKTESVMDPESATIKSTIINAINLQRAWQSSKIVAREDWNQWLRTFSTALVRESPSPAIRACGGLSTVTPTVAKTLFNAGFVSCWPELQDIQQDDLISTLELALKVDQPEVSQTILNLAEFTAHCERGNLPLRASLLADRAMKNRAYAKALYYREQEFLEQQQAGQIQPETLSALLSINNKLQLEEASTGVLQYASKLFKDKLSDEEAWYEKLHYWTKALHLYDSKLEETRFKDNNSLILGRMRCLKALGEWKQLNEMAQDRWPVVDESTRQKMGPLVANAAWSIGAWSDMYRYIEVVPKDTYQGSFLRAVQAINENEFEFAQDCIDKSRDILDSDLTAMAGESYNRAYGDIVNAQMLSELEEIIQYKLVSDRQDVLKQAWRERLLGCQSVVEDWCQILQIRSLVIKPREDIKTWLKFAGLCRKSGRMNLSNHILTELVPGADTSKLEIEGQAGGVNPAIIFAYTKQLWAQNKQNEAIKRLTHLIDKTLKPFKNDHLEHLERENRLEEHKQLIAKCCLKLGTWFTELNLRNAAGIAVPDERVRFEKQQSYVIRLYRTATEEWPSLRQAWQNWALANYAAIKYLNSRLIQINDDKNNLIQEIQNQNSTSTIPANIQSPSCPPSGMSNIPLSVTPVILPEEMNTPNTKERNLNIDPKLTEIGHATIEGTAGNGNSTVQPGKTLVSEELSAGERRATVDQEEEMSQSSGARSVHRSVSLRVQLNRLEEQRLRVKTIKESHSAPAVRGFVNSISLSSSSNLQDSLRLINLLFEFGELSIIRETIREGMNKIKIVNWLLVIQQLLARIDTNKEHVANIIVDLLISVGRKHPQAMINPLILAFKSGGSDRRRHYANKILYSIEEHSPKLVSEGFMLNEELIRLAISFMEMWHECLEDASRVYFGGDRDIKRMFKLLHPLHAVLERQPETMNEIAFHQDYFSELNTAKEWCIRYENTGHLKELQQAWEVYYNLYRKLAKHVSNVTMLELTCASPRLADYPDDWLLAIPGSYEPNKPVVTIKRVKNTLNFITSKQRPRKMSIIGSDGHSYMFLLKGHEDIRQDERIMQFFGLVNTLLMNNAETFRRNLTIQRMSVIPLSTSTGLIGWVPSSDTLHSLIRDQREKAKVLLNLEHRAMLKMAPDFDRLNVIQKTEVFEQGLLESNGRDLANILWLKSHSSEAWFERRTNFIRSLATMSMVGYILGLGDRHPSNIMLCRESGKVIHIDFGDCFEVAMTRDKFPEKVPFRLTRMIIEAMEVTGIEGTFRQTCEQVLGLMRSNRESLLAVLEAFLHDPLLSWVVLEDKKDFNDKKGLVRQNTNQPQMPTQTMNQPPGQGPHQRPNCLPYSGHPAQPPAPHGPPAPGLHRAPGQVLQHGDNHPPQPAGRMGATVDRTRRIQGLNPTGQVWQIMDQGYPDSGSLRNPQNVNHWRQHLCNGPWLGCYETAKKMRKTLDNGAVVVERKGIQGFIFSAKPLTEDQRSESEDHKPVGNNARALDVMAHIHNKLSGDELGRNLEVKEQVQYLIREATSNKNLCQMYIGWCAFW